MWDRLIVVMCGIILALSVFVGGCITMPDGTNEPDYEMISFGTVLAFSVIINETKVSDEKVMEAYEGLSHASVVLRSMGESGQPVDLAVVDQILADAVPMEYKAIAKQGSKLIRDRARRYLGENIPDVDLTKHKVVAEIASAVVEGAKAALEPKVYEIKK